jgi:hypothetical protein
MSKAYKNPKAKVISASDKYQVIIAENAEVLIDCMDGEGDTSAGESFFADSLEEAERILTEHTAVPGKGGVINVPEGSGESPMIVLPMRTRNAIDKAEGEFFDKVWYDRHQIRKSQLGEDAARCMEDKYGKAKLGPYTDFEWGMINGKLSALRWVLGDEWDMLDT